MNIASILNGDPAARVPRGILYPDDGEPLHELAALLAIDEDLVEFELRPILRSLKARRRICDRCRRPYIQKRRHSRRRGFCGDTCRSAARGRTESR